MALYSCNLDTMTFIRVLAHVHAGDDKRKEAFKQNISFCQGCFKLPKQIIKDGRRI